MSNIVGQFCKFLRFTIPANILDNIFLYVWNLLCCSNFHFISFRIFFRHFYFCFEKSRHVGHNIGRNVVMYIANRTDMLVEMLAEMLARFAPPLRTILRLKIYVLNMLFIVFDFYRSICLGYFGNSLNLLDLSLIHI